MPLTGAPRIFAAAPPIARPPIWPLSPDSGIDNARGASTIGVMRNRTRPDLLILAGLYLQNEKSFVVRRCVQRFLAGEISSREAIARIRRHPGVRDEDPDRPAGT